LLALLRGDSIEMDSLGRPTSFFGKTVHDECPRLERFTASDFALAPGDPARCLFKLGCKGMMARGDCPSRLWQGSRAKGSAAQVGLKSSRRVHLWTRLVFSV